MFDAILAAGGCKAPDATVNIYCKAVEESGELQFTMRDADNTIVATFSSKDPTKLVADLITIVRAGTVVFWEWDEASEVKEFVKIAPQVYGKIIPRDPKEVDGSKKKLMLVIPGNVEPGQESYYIQFVWKGETVTIDPHLKVPDQDRQ